MRSLYFWAFSLIAVLFSSTAMAQPSYDMSTRTVTDNSGYLYDDGGPTGNYGDSVIYTFTIQASNGKPVKLQFLEFFVESNQAGVNNICVFDYVEIFDGVPGAITGARYCGTSLPPVLEATGNTVTVRLTTDDNSNRTGFKAYWTTDELLPPADAAYCPGTMMRNCATSWCKRVKLANIDNNNDTCDVEATNTGVFDGYSDYTSKLAIMGTDSVYQMEVEIGNSLILERVSVWFDWNGDHSWDLSELTVLVGNAYAVNLFTGIITPQLSTALGQIVRFRVMTDFGEVETTQDINACEPGFQGEVEDYSFIVFGPDDAFPACVNYSTAKPADSSMNNCLKQVLRWDSAANATSYIVSLIEDATNTIIVDRVSTPDTFFVVNATLKPNTVYRWKAISVNGTTEGYMCDSAIFTTSPNADPTAKITPTGNPVEACINNAFAIDGSPTGGTPAFTSKWTGSGATYLSDVNLQNPNFNGNTLGTYKLYYSAVDANGCKAVDSVNIRVISQANGGTISKLSKDTVCQGIPLNFKVVGSSGVVSIQDSTSGGSWAPLTTSKINDTTYQVTPSVTGTYFFRSEASGTNCSAIGTGMIQLVVTAAPAAPVIKLVGNDTICQGQSMKLVTTNYQSGITWNDAVSTVNDTITISATGDYTATYSGAACPSSSVATHIEVMEYPDRSIEFSGSLESCVNTPPLLFTNQITGETILWNNAATTKAINPSVSGNYFFTKRNAAGCISKSDTLKVVLNPVPAKPIITQNSSPNPCLGEPVEFESNYPTGNTWSNGRTTQKIIVYTSGTYNLSYTDSKGCSAVSDDIDLDFRPAPVRPKVAVDGKLKTCIGDTVNLSVNTANTSSWNDENLTYGNTLEVLKSGAYFAVHTNDDGCVVYSDTAVVEMTQFQADPTITVKGSLCEGNTVLLITNHPKGNVWTDDNTMTNDTIKVTSDGDYFVVNTQNRVCVAYSDTVSIVFEPRPARPDIYELGDSLFSSVVGYSYQWLNEKGIVSNSNHISIKPKVTSFYRVIVYSESGCASDASPKYFKGFTGIEELSLAGYDVYPSPFEKNFTVDSKAKNATYTLINALGKQVASGKLKTGKNDIHVDVAIGIYTLNIKDENGVISTKLIKQ